MANIYQASFVIQVHCDACKSVHTINFRDRAEFDRVRCPFDHTPVFRTPAIYTKVFNEFQKDVFSEYALAS